MRKICLIDEFAKSNPCNFTASELEIIRSWNNKVSGTFFVVKYTPDGAIFLEEVKNGRVIGFSAYISKLISTGNHLNSRKWDSLSYGKQRSIY
jgi:hypothetical protein